MKYEIDGTLYDVIIIKKNNKNLYIRVKDDGNIYVTCNFFTTKSLIKKVLDANVDSLRKMLFKVNNKKEEP